MGWDRKFVLTFRELIREYFAADEHKFIIYGVVETELAPAPDTVIYPSLFKNAIPLAKTLHQADKIILHGLFSSHLLYLLALQPWLLKKCYWVMWGGDLYHYQLRTRGLKSDIQEMIRAFIIKRIGHFITYVKGDYELAKKWYGVKGEYHDCLMYPSNLCKDYVVPPKQGYTVNILVGNSADPTNNHAEVFEKIKPYKDQDIQIYCPLSYGPVEYAEKMAKLGTELFGDKFTPLLDFMPFEKYLELLGQIDIAVFAHKRQQAMGNMISLLGLGKKVYLRSDVTSWQLFQDLGVKVFDTQYIDLLSLDVDDRMHNQQIITTHFSKATLIEQWRDIFKG